MNSGHVTERVRVHVCTSGSSKRDFVLLELLTLEVSTNTTIFKGITSACHASAIADHVTSTGHNLKWDHFEILAKGRSYTTNYARCLGNKVVVLSKPNELVLWHNRF